MHTIRIPKVINFGEDALGQTDYPKNALIVTTVPPELSDKFLDFSAEISVMRQKFLPKISIHEKSFFSFLPNFDINF